jgi:formylglycine-generating enzyme required for sulfatase activity
MIDLSRLSEYVMPHEELKIHRIEYGSQGFVEVAGSADALDRFASFVTAQIYLYYQTKEIRKEIEETEKRLEEVTEPHGTSDIENRQRELENQKTELENQQLLLQNASEFVKSAKHWGMSDLEIREKVKWLAHKEENLRHLLDNGKVISALTMQEGYMVRIPAGMFLYGPNKEEGIIDQDYFIDVFPVTNEQYEKFIEAGGYQNDTYWSEEGKKWRQVNKITRPKFWDNKRWNQPDHPVVGVSFYEAEACAKWASKRLPTELEWERAARGTDGRIYPWGDIFDEGKSNSRESGIGKTTKVSRYPNSISPAGCYDMAGNVWEWTVASDELEDHSVVCGGSWFNKAQNAGCASRYGLYAYFRYYDVGFRCAGN